MGDNDKGAVAGSFNFAAQMPNGKSLTFSGYILQGESLADINAKLDIAEAVVERQRRIAEIPELEAKLEQQLQSMRQANDIIKDAARRHQEMIGKDRLTTSEKVQIEKYDEMVQTHQANLAHLETSVAKGRLAVAEAKALRGHA
jgi:uncharacterized protein YciI